MHRVTSSERNSSRIKSPSRLRCCHCRLRRRRRSVISRARERVANRISEDARAIRRRWKSEEKSKGRALAGGYREARWYRGNQSRGCERVGGGFVRERAGGSTARRGEGARRKRDERAGRPRGRIGACVIRYLSTCQPSGAATTLALSLSLSLSLAAPLLDNKLYSTSTGTVLRTTGSPSLRWCRSRLRKANRRPRSRRRLPPPLGRHVSGDLRARSRSHRAASRTECAPRR